MPDVEQEIASAQSRIEAARSALTRAQIEREQAEKIRDQTKATLKSEFGIETGADIERVRSELQAELDSLVTKIKADLEAAGA